MKKSQSCQQVWIILTGLLFLSTNVAGLKGNVLVLNKLRAGTTSEGADTSGEQHHGGSSDVSQQDRVGGGSQQNDTSRHALTGIPQVDYVYDPNLPRELNGYNLTEYPFYDRVPEDLDFKCDGLHDGFYASVLHKCQVYHHCLFGTRYDFLCANYTAFDQKTFICHFVSEVDCVNSPKYFNRNEALYKAQTTTTTTVAPPPPPPPLPAPAQLPPARRPNPGRQRRPLRRRRPQYEYYDDDEYEDDVEYYDDEVGTTATGSGSNRKQPRPQQRPAAERPTDELHDVPAESGADLKPKPSGTVYDRPRIPPKVRRPVPLNEREKYDYSKHPSAIPTSTVSMRDDIVPSRAKPAAAPVADDVEYYDDEEEYVAPARPAQTNPKNKDYYPQTAPADRETERRNPPPRRRSRPAGTRRRVPVSAVDSSTQRAALPLEYEGDYDDASYEDEPRRVVRPVASGGRRRKQPARQEPEYRRPQVPYRQDSEEDYAQAPRPHPSQSRRNNAPVNTHYEDESFSEEPIPAPRPAYISSSAPGYSNRRRPQVQPEEEYVPQRPHNAGTRRQVAPARRRPASSTYPTGYADDEEYYDDEEEEVEEPIYRTRPRQRPSYRPTVEREQVDPLPPRPQNVNRKPQSSAARPGNSNLPPRRDDDVGYVQPARGTSQQESVNQPIERPAHQTPYRDRPENTQYQPETSPSRPSNNDYRDPVPADLDDDDIRIARPRNKGEPNRTPEENIMSHQNPNYNTYAATSEAIPEQPVHRPNNYYDKGGDQRLTPDTYVPANNQPKVKDTTRNTEPSNNNRNYQTNTDNRNYQNRQVNKNPSIYEPTEENINAHSRDTITSVPQRTAYNPVDNRHKPIIDNQEVRTQSSNVNPYKPKPPSLREPSSTTSVGKYRDHITTQAPHSSSEKPVTENYREYTNPKKPYVEVTVSPSRKVTKPVIKEEEVIPLSHNLADVIDAENDVTQSDLLLLEKNNIPSAPGHTSGDLPRFRVKLFKTKLSQSYIPASAPSNTESSSLTGYGDEGSSTRGGSPHLIEAASQRQITRTIYPKEKETTRPYSQPLSLSTEIINDRRPHYNQQRHSAWQVAEELSVYRS